MNKKEYYSNKVLYALTKIDYAMSKMKGEKNRKEFSKIYQVLMTYDGKVNMDIMMRMTQLGREIIVPKLKELKDMGVIDWDGTYLNQEKEIKSNVDIKEWYRNLLVGMKEKGMEIKESDEKFLQEYESKETSKEQNQEKVTVKSQGVSWVEIEVEDGLIIKTTKEKLKEKLLG